MWSDYVQSDSTLEVIQNQMRKMIFYMWSDATSEVILHMQWFSKCAKWIYYPGEEFHWSMFQKCISV
jgi:hypothetical protein